MKSNQANKIYKEIEENRFDSGLETAIADRETEELYLFGSLFSIDELESFLSNDIQLIPWNVDDREYLVNKLTEMIGENFEVMD